MPVRVAVWVRGRGRLTAPSSRNIDGAFVPGLPRAPRREPQREPIPGNISQSIHRPSRPSVEGSFSTPTSAPLPIRTGEVVRVPALGRSAALWVRGNHPSHASGRRYPWRTRAAARADGRLDQALQRVLGAIDAPVVGSRWRGRREAWKAAGASPRGREAEVSPQSLETRRSRTRGDQLPLCAARRFAITELRC